MLKLGGDIAGMVVVAIIIVAILIALKAPYLIAVGIGAWVYHNHNKREHICSKCEGKDSDTRTACSRDITSR